MGSELFFKVADKYPFFSFFLYSGIEYIGVIQNKDVAFTTFYDFGNILDAEHKKLFVELASVWWEESNRTIPINIFLRGEWDIFKPYLRTFSNKELELLHGPCISLHELASHTKSKRRSITLVRRIS
jgi:hypothetical protein